MKKIALLFVILFSLSSCSFNSLIKQGEGSFTFSGQQITSILNASRNVIIPQETYTISVELTGTYKASTKIKVTGEQITSNNMPPIVIEDIPVDSKVSVILKIYDSRDNLLVVGTSKESTIKSGENEITITISFSTFENENVLAQAISEGIKITPKLFSSDTTKYRIIIEDDDSSTVFYSVDVVYRSGFDCSFVYKYVQEDKKYHITVATLKENDDKTEIIEKIDCGTLFAKGGNGERYVKLQDTPYLDLEEGCVKVNCVFVGFTEPKYESGIRLLQLENASTYCYGNGVMSVESPNEICISIEDIGGIIEFSPWFVYQIDCYIECSLDFSFMDDDKNKYSACLLSPEVNNSKFKIPREMEYEDYIQKDDYVFYKYVDTDYYDPLTKAGLVINNSVTNFSQLKTILTDSNLTSKFSGCDEVELYLTNAKITKLECGNNHESLFTDFTMIYVSDSIEEIGEYTFYNCSKLSRLYSTFGLDNLTTIGASAFENCTKLNEFENTPNLISIGSKAFKNCEGLNTLDMDAKVAIGTEAFDGCESLRWFTYNLNNELFETDKKIIEKEYDGIPYRYLQTPSLSFEIQPDEIRIEIRYMDLSPDVYHQKISYIVETIIPAFNNRFNTSSPQLPLMFSFMGEGWNVNIPKIMAKSIEGTSKTSYFKDFRVVNIEGDDCSREIDEYAFADCENLQSVSISKSVKTIRSNAFKNCSKLEYAIFSDYDNRDWTLKEESQQDIDLTVEYGNYFETNAIHLNETYLNKTWVKKE